MTERTNGTYVHWKMSRPRRNALAAMLMTMGVVASALTPAYADDRMRVEGTFTIQYAYPSAVNFCGDGAGSDNVSVQAQGLGNIPGLGPMFMTVKKCFSFTDGPHGTYAGTFTLSAANGDTLTGIYRGTQGPYDENGFNPFWGVLTVTRGTGRFRNTTGQLWFDATSGPDSAGAIAPTLTGMAFYLVRGTLVSRADR